MNTFFFILPLIIIIVPLSFFIVKQQTAAVIERFGKFTSIRHSGLQLKIPVIDRIAGKLSLKIQQLFQNMNSLKIEILLIYLYHLCLVLILFVFLKVENILIIN